MTFSLQAMQTTFMATSSPVCTLCPGIASVCMRGFQTDYRKNMELRDTFFNAKDFFISMHSVFVFHEDSFMRQKGRQTS